MKGESITINLKMTKAITYSKHYRHLNVNALRAECFTREKMSLQFCDRNFLQNLMVQSCSQLKKQQIIPLSFQSHQCSLMKWRKNLRKRKRLMTSSYSMFRGKNLH